MLLLTLAVKGHVTAILALDRLVTLRHRPRDERGQTTAEYALVLFGAAPVALLVVSWAHSTGKIGKLLDTIVEQVIDMVK